MSWQVQLAFQHGFYLLIFIFRALLGMFEYCESTYKIKLENFKNIYGLIQTKVQVKFIPKAFYILSSVQFVIVN